MTRGSPSNIVQLQHIPNIAQSVVPHYQMMIPLHPIPLCIENTQQAVNLHSLKLIEARNPIVVARLNKGINLWPAL